MVHVIQTVMCEAVNAGKVLIITRYTSNDQLQSSPPLSSPCFSMMLQWTLYSLFHSVDHGGCDTKQTHSASNPTQQWSQMAWVSESLCAVMTRDITMLYQLMRAVWCVVVRKHISSNIASLRNMSACLLAFYPQIGSHSFFLWLKHRYSCFTSCFKEYCATFIQTIVCLHWSLWLFSYVVWERMNTVTLSQRLWRLHYSWWQCILRPHCRLGPCCTHPPFTNLLFIEGGSV